MGSLLSKSFFKIDDFLPHHLFIRLPLVVLTVKMLRSASRDRALQAPNEERLNQTGQTDATSSNVLPSWQGEDEPNQAEPNSAVFLAAVDGEESTTTREEDEETETATEEEEKEGKEGAEEAGEENEVEEQEEEALGSSFVSTAELIEQKQREWFAGSREWLFEEVRQWLRGSEKRLCWLVGGAGTGKSVATAQLLATAGVREHVKAWHFCRHDNAAASDVKLILESWAAMLTNNLTGFAEASSQIREDADEDDVKDADEDENSVVSAGQASGGEAVLSAREMFKLLIADPLTRVTAQPSSPCVIVLDALDELPRGSVNDVLQLLAEEFDKLPSFMRLFVASRDEALISKRLERFEQVKLEVDELRNRADLRMYLAQVARRHVTLEQGIGMADLEKGLEREFKLAPFRLRGELRGLDEAIGKCKDIYAAAISKLEQQTSDADSFRAICNDIRGFKPKTGNDKARRQCVGDLDQLYIDAEEAHEKLKCLLLANKHLRELINPGLKSRDSASRKTRSEYGGDFSRLKDLVRFTALFSNCAQMKLFVDNLCEGGTTTVSGSTSHKEEQTVWPGVVVFALKNKYSSPSVLGHRDLNLTLGVQLASGRIHLCELQVNLEGMMAAARLTHSLYEEVRSRVPEVCKRAEIKDEDWFKAKLSKMLRSSVLENAVRELEQKAGGLFLYASLLARHLETMEHKVEFAALQALPDGLSEIYEMNFGRMVMMNMAKDANEQKEEEGPNQEARERWLAYSQLISLVVAAREPLPVTLARELVGEGCEEMEQTLSLLFPVREGRFQVMHKSVADWLQDSKRESLFVIGKEDIHAAHRSMGQYFHRCLAQPAQQQVDSGFCVRHVVYHLCMAGLWDEVYAVVSSVEGWLLKRAQMSPLGMVLDLELAASFEGSPHHSTIRLMGQALRMDLDEVRQDHRTVPGRLVGRLIGHETKEVQELLDEVRKWSGPPEGWWCPMHASLEPAGGSLVSILILRDSCECVQWNPGNTNQLAIAEAEQVCIYEAQSGECIRTLEGHSKNVASVSWSSDGSRICSGGDDGTVRVWEVASGECILTLRGHSEWVNSVSWSSDGSRICSGGHDNTVRVWDVASGECIQTLQGDSKWVASVSWSSDGSRICSGDDDDTVRVWEVASGECILTLQGDSHSSVSWSSDSSRICSGSSDNTVRVWEVASGECIQTLQGHSEYVISVSWSSDGSRICSGSRDSTVRVWDVASGECIGILQGHSGHVTSVSWSNDGSRICSGGWESKVRVWEVTGECARTLRGHLDEVISVSWSSDGSRICSGSYDETVRVWEVASGKCIQTLLGHSAEVVSVLWSSDDRRICSGSWDLTVRVWEVTSGECIRTFEGHSDTVNSVSWSSDDSRICSASNDKTVRVWDVASGDCIRTLEGHSSWVTSVSWSGDDCSRIRSWSFDDTVRVWDVTSGECVRTGHSDDNEYIQSLQCHWLPSGDCLQNVGGHPDVPSGPPPPIGFEVCSISVNPANPRSAVAVEHNAIHCLSRLGIELN